MGLWARGRSRRSIVGAARLALGASSRRTMLRRDGPLIAHLQKPRGLGRGCVVCPVATTDSLAVDIDPRVSSERQLKTTRAW